MLMLEGVGEAWPLLNKAITATGAEFPEHLGGSWSCGGQMKASIGALPGVGWCRSFLQAAGMGSSLSL